jgi:hypothetical protein
MKSVSHKKEMPKAIQKGGAEDFQKQQNYALRGALDE